MNFDFEISSVDDETYYDTTWLQTLTRLAKDHISGVIGSFHLSKTIQKSKSVL